MTAKPASHLNSFRVAIMGSLVPALGHFPTDAKVITVVLGICLALVFAIVCFRFGGFVSVFSAKRSEPDAGISLRTKPVSGITEDAVLTPDKYGWSAETGPGPQHHADSEKARNDPLEAAKDSTPKIAFYAFLVSCLMFLVTCLMMVIKVYFKEPVAAAPEQHRPQVIVSPTVQVYPPGDAPHVVSQGSSSRVMPLEWKSSGESPYRIG